MLPTGVFAGISTALVTAVTLRGAADTGALILGLFVAGLTVAGGLFGVKYKTAAKVAETNARLWEDQCGVYHEKAESLERDKNELLKAISQSRDVISKLESLPNLAKVIELMQKTAESQDRHFQDRFDQAITVWQQMMENHEVRAEHRHLALMALLERSITT